MDENDFKNLIKDLPTEQQKKAILLYNGHVETANKYRNESTAANLWDWKASENAFNEFMDSIKPSKNNDQPAFKNRAEVLEYLRGQEVKISRGKLYKDADTGKLRMESDGSILLMEVDKYIKSALKPFKKAGTAPDIEKLQTEKLERENDKLDEQIKKLIWEREKETGKYILRDDFEMEIVARAAVFAVSLKQMVSIKALDWVSIVQGNHALVKDMTDAIIRDIESVLNDYATTDTFQVMIDKG